MLWITLIIGVMAFIGYMQMKWQEGENIALMNRELKQRELKRRENKNNPQS